MVGQPPTRSLKISWNNYSQMVFPSEHQPAFSVSERLKDWSTGHVSPRLWITVRKSDAQKTVDNSMAMTQEPKKLEVPTIYKAYIRPM